MIGEIVGNYEVVQKLGEGGMGVVYLATHKLIGQKVAVKVLRPEHSDNTDVVRRFFNEARATALIRHPGLVDVLDFGTHASGAAYIAMEFLDGENLSARLARQKVLEPELVYSIIRQVALAVGAAHGKAIAHRDLKPDNIFLVPDPSMPLGVRVKVLDFGIAKLMFEGSGTGMAKTTTSAIMGTPLYMSPEQCRGAGFVDHRTDIYSLGCILFKMFCGKPPFDLKGGGELIAAHIHEAPPSPSTLNPNVHPRLEALILKMLAKSPAERIQTMQAVVEEIDALSGGMLSVNRKLPTAPGAIPVASSEPLPMPTPVPTPSRNRPKTPARGVAVAEPAWAAGPADVATASTTLGGAAAEKQTQPPPAPRGKGWIAVAAVASLAAVGGVVAMKHTSAPPAAIPSAAPAQPAAAAAPPAPSPMPAGKITLKIESNPPGAQVSQRGGERLGTTPLELTRTPWPGEIELVVQRAGYQDGLVKLRTDQNGATTVQLAKLDVPAAPAGKPKRLPKKPGGAINDGTLDPFEGQ